MSFAPEAADKPFNLYYMMNIHTPEPTLTFASSENYPFGQLHAEISPDKAAEAMIVPPYIDIMSLPALLQHTKVNVTVTTRAAGP